MEFVSSWIAAHRRSRCASSRLLSGVHLPRSRGSRGRGGCLRVELWKGSIRVLHDPDEFYNVLIVSGVRRGGTRGEYLKQGSGPGNSPTPRWTNSENPPALASPPRKHAFPRT